MPENTNKEWEKEFDDKIGDVYSYGGDERLNEYVKSFISTLLQQQREELIKKIEKYDDTRHNQEANETVKDILDLIKQDK